MTPTIDEIVIGDPAEAWAAAGFTVDPDEICRVGAVRIRLVGRHRGERILEWSLRDLATGDRSGEVPDGFPGDDDGLLDGLVTIVSERSPAIGAEHPNGVIDIDHVVIASPDCDRTVRALELAGFEARRTRHTDTYGSPMRQTFFRAGEVIVELVGPDEPTGDGPAVFFGLAFTVADLDATAALLGDDLGTAKDAVQPGRRIATLRHRQLGLSVATAMMSPDPRP